MKLWSWNGVYKETVKMPDLEAVTMFQKLNPDNSDFVSAHVDLASFDVVKYSQCSKNYIKDGGDESSTSFYNLVGINGGTSSTPRSPWYHTFEMLEKINNQVEVLYLIGDTDKMSLIVDANNSNGNYETSPFYSTYLGTKTPYYDFPSPEQHHTIERGKPLLYPARYQSGGIATGAPSFNTTILTKTGNISPTFTSYKDLKTKPGYSKFVDDIVQILKNNNLSVIEELKKKSVRLYMVGQANFNENNWCYATNNDWIAPSSQYNYCEDAYRVWKKDVDDGILTGQNETKLDNIFIVTWYTLKWIKACLDANAILQIKPEEPVDNVTEYFGESGSANIEFTWKNEPVDSGGLTYSDYKIYVHGEIVKKTENILDVLTSFNQADDLQVETDYSAKRITLPLKETISSMKSVGDIVGDLLLDYCAVFYLRGISDNQQRNTCFYICDTQTGKYISCGQMPDEQSIFTDTINHGSVPSDDDNTDNTVDSDEPNTPNTPDVVGIGLLTTTYGLTPTKLKSIGSFIWESDWLNNLELVNNNPVENIVSCKVFPLTLPDGTDLIKIGNVATQVLGGKIDTTTYRVVQDVGELTVPKKFNSFLDYEPYTQLKLYVPFVGFVPISCASAYDGLSFRYAFDLINGSFTCSLKSGGKIVATYTGNCGVDIPITSNNRAQVETGYIRSALDLSTNPINIVNVGLDIATSQFHSQTVGNMGATTGLCQNLTPYVLAERPIASQPSTYGHDIGFKCEQSKTISELSGYTEINNIDIKGLSCTENEKNMIAQILATGFYA